MRHEHLAFELKMNRNGPKNDCDRFEMMLLFAGVGRVKLQIGRAHV